MKRRIVINRAQDNGPTPERMAKVDYEDVKNGKTVLRRKSDSLKALLKSGYVEQQHVDAAERWYRDYVLFNNGKFESSLDRELFFADEQAWARQDRIIAEIEEERKQGYAHDSVTWGVMRGRAGCRLSVVREKLREPGVQLLKFMLADGISFCEMAKALLPAAPSDYNAARGLKAQCAFVLKQLEDIYRPENRSLFDVCRFSKKRIEERRLEKVA